MNDKSYTTSFVVEQPPDEVFAAIIDPRSWWSRAIEGDTSRLGAEWSYRYQDVHRARLRVSELEPGARVVWRVLDNYFDFVKDAKEWTGTDIVFDIDRTPQGTRVRFTHVGLNPSHECYDICSDAWGNYVTGSLRDLIATGAGRPNPIEEIVARAREMARGSYSTTFSVEQSPAEVFASINDVRAWWSGDIEGRTDAQGAEFTYRHGALHHSTQRITEWVPDRKVVWHVVAADLSFVRDHGEWKGTDIVFELEPKGAGTKVRFTHVGLVPTLECYDDCSGAWTHYIEGALRDWVTKRPTAATPVS